MKLTIKQLRLINFKGIKELTVNITKETNIFGDNRSGKTRIFDSYLWLLFGKDSLNQADFDIMPLDSQNNIIDYSDVEVEGLFDIDGREVRLMKLLKQKWTKKSGDDFQTYTGDIIIYYINNLVVKKSEYESFIQKTIGDLEKILLISDPLYFHSEKFNWTRRRELLFNLVPEITDKQIIEKDKDFEELIKNIFGKDLINHKKSLAQKINKLKDDLKLIQPRIDENERKKNTDIDFDELEKKKENIEIEVNKIEVAIKDKIEATNLFNEKYVAWQLSLFDVKNKHQELKNKIELEYKSFTDKENQSLLSFKEQSKMFENRIESLEVEIKRLSEQIDSKKEVVTVLRSKWIKKNEEKLIIDPEAFICPTCKQTLPDPSMIENDLLKNFNIEKRSILDKINKEGQLLNEEIEIISESISKKKEAIIIANKEFLEIKNKIIDLEKLIEEKPTLEEYLNTNEEYIKSLSKLSEINKTEPQKREADTEELTIKKVKLSKDISEIDTLLSKKLDIIECDNRIKALTNEIKNKAILITELEKEYFLIEKYEKTKTEILSKSINDNFKFCSFKFYKQLKNGGEEPVCITLINGIPYRSANYESKINSGIEVIRVLREHFNIQMPLFVDNRESITEIVDINSQVINLFKESGTKQLRIENK